MNAIKISNLGGREHVAACVWNQDPKECATMLVVSVESQKAIAWTANRNDWNQCCGMVWQRWGFSLIFGIYGSVFPYAFIMAVVWLWLQRVGRFFLSTSIGEFLILQVSRCPFPSIDLYGSLAPVGLMLLTKPQCRNAALTFGVRSPRLFYFQFRAISQSFHVMSPRMILYSRASAVSRFPLAWNIAMASTPTLRPPRWLRPNLSLFAKLTRSSWNLAAGLKSPTTHLRRYLVAIPIVHFRGQSLWAMKGKGFLLMPTIYQTVL